MHTSASCKFHGVIAAMDGCHCRTSNNNAGIQSLGFHGESITKAHESVVWIRQSLRLCSWGEWLTGGLLGWFEVYI